MQVRNNELLSQILSVLQSIQSDYRQLSTAVDTIEGRVNVLAGVKQIYDAAENRQGNLTVIEGPAGLARNHDIDSSPNSLVTDGGPGSAAAKTTKHAPSGRSSGTTASTRIVLTTYPGQSGIDPLVMNWGHHDPSQRGPVVVSRSQSTIRRRNGTR